VRFFDAPNAGSGYGQGTFPMGINPWDQVPGFTLDANGVYHGFLYTPGRRVIGFDAPEAGNSPGQGTEPMTVSPMGVVTGFYIDAKGAVHGFQMY
jgi:hypothetical protein